MHIGCPWMIVQILIARDIPCILCKTMHLNGGDQLMYKKDGEKSSGFSHKYDKKIV